MKIVAAVIVVLALASSVALADAAPSTRYFGPGPGYPDLGDKYFYRYYPPSDWGQYGYGTGHMGVGYGPYIYGKYRLDRSAAELRALAPYPVQPKMKRIGYDQVRVYMPENPRVVSMTVNVVADAAVIETGTVSAPPYEIIAHVPAGADVIQVQVNLVDGISAVGYPLIPGY